jgi:hypothetical protein
LKKNIYYDRKYDSLVTGDVDVWFAETDTTPLTLKKTEQK